MILSSYKLGSTKRANINKCLGCFDAKPLIPNWCSAKRTQARHRLVVSHGILDPFANSYWPASLKFAWRFLLFELDIIWWFLLEAMINRSVEHSTVNQWNCLGFKVTFFEKDFVWWVYRLSITTKEAVILRN